MWAIIPLWETVVRTPARALGLGVVVCIGTLPTDGALARARGAAASTPPPLLTPAGARTPPPTTPGHDLAVQISEYIRCIFQDRDGDLWMGTNGDGVARYDGEALVFFQIKDGLGGHAVREIVQTADGAMWFTTEGGVSRHHGGTIRNYTAADGLSSDDTWSMMLDRGGTLWVGTREGVCRFEGAGEADAGTKAKPFVAFPLPRAEVGTGESKFDPRLVWSMFEDREGNIWFGTDGDGARKFDGKGFTTYTTKEGLGGNQVRCILGDRHGRIWMGGDGWGVSRLDGKEVRAFTAADGLANDRVFRIYEDRAGSLWFSTLGDGVTRYDGEVFTAHRQLGALARTHVQDIFQDRDGTLWFGCSGGLFRLEGGEFVNVTKDGPWR